jgi:hypothetical protein
MPVAPIALRLRRTNAAWFVLRELLAILVHMRWRLFDRINLLSFL